MTGEYDDVRKTVSESEDKLELKWKCKRGTDTRNEDRFDAKVKGDGAEEVVAEMRRLIEGVEGADGDSLMDKARGIQPDSED